MINNVYRHFWVKILTVLGIGTIVLLNFFSKCCSKTLGDDSVWESFLTL